MKRARDIRDQLLGLMDRCEIELRSAPQDVDAIRKAITSGFFYHTSSLQKNGSYRTVKNPQVWGGGAGGACVCGWGTVHSRAANQPLAAAYTLAPPHAHTDRTPSPRFPACPPTHHTHMQTVHIHPSSGLSETMPRWLVYHELGGWGAVGRAVGGGGAGSAPPTPHRSAHAGLIPTMHPPPPYPPPPPPPLPAFCPLFMYCAVLTTKEYMRVVSEIKPEWLVGASRCCGSCCCELYASRPFSLPGLRVRVACRPSFVNHLCLLPARPCPSASHRPTLPPTTAGRDRAALLQQEGDHGAGGQEAAKGCGQGDGGGVMACGEPPPTSRRGAGLPSTAPGGNSSRGRTSSILVCTHNLNEFRLCSRVRSAALSPAQPPPPRAAAPLPCRPAGAAAPQWSRPWRPQRPAAFAAAPPPLPPCAAGAPAAEPPPRP